MPTPQPSVKVPGPRSGKHRRSAVSRVLLWTSLFLAAVLVAAGLFGFYAYSEYSMPGPLAEDKVYMIAPGQSVTGIGDALEQNGIIFNGRIFALMAELTGQRTRLKAGEYAFAKDASMSDVMALLASGKAVTYKISIPEGFTSQMAVDRVNANEVLTGDAAAVPPEGSILPDTYVFRRGMTRQKLVQDMQTAETKLIDELWDKRQPVPVITTKDQAVTLASIVEKETAVPEERPLIASVFINRLAKGMRLQSDPTIIYGIAGGKGRLDRPLSKADIEAATPYNTYRINGLPPGPIANPGRAALEAVLNPQPTDKLYFVADGSGGHAFAATLEEHNRNVKKWRQIAGNEAAAAAADDGDQAPAPDTAEPPATSTADAGNAPLADVAPEPDAPAATPAPVATQTPAPAAAPPATQQQASATPPKPQVKPAPAAKTAVPDASSAPLKPGTVLTVEGHATVIPRLRPAP